MLRVLVLVLALPLAGCLDVPGATPAASLPDPAAAPPLPEPVEGRAWLPPSNGQEREETLILVADVPAAATMEAHVVLAGFYGAALPPVLADVRVELRDASGAVLAEGHLAPGEPEARLEGVIGAPGDATLALLSYGGSDGSAYGDHVDYRISFR